ncbi:MAG: hypothetical protein GC150_12900 [Rhizobiales bacterium]|nr:hypothetical protein [Hyphomicrobiales bacterium]
MTRTMGALALAGLFIATVAGEARAGCNDLGIVGGTVTIDAGSFNPLLGSDLNSANRTIFISNSGPGSCNVSALIREAPAVANPVKEMKKGADTLSYRALSASPLSFTVPGNGQASVTVFVRIEAALNPFLPAGLYEDAGINEVYIYEGNTASDAAVRAQAPFVATATVAAACDLPPPDVATLDFSSAISNGLANTGAVLSSGFSGVRCTSPASITLTADALRRSPSGAPVAGFDNFINFRAEASFDGANVVLETEGDSGDETATSAGQSSAATSGGSVVVDVNLMAGNPILAGAYSGVLTVAVDPGP